VVQAHGNDCRSPKELVEALGVVLGDLQLQFADNFDVPLRLYALFCGVDLPGALAGN
jgi:hypothetical protein